MLYFSKMQKVSFFIVILVLFFMSDVLLFFKVLFERGFLGLNLKNLGLDVFRGYLMVDLGVGGIIVIFFLIVFFCLIFSILVILV